MSSFVDRLSPASRHRLLVAGTERCLGDGEHLVGKGELGSDLFLVVAGAVEARDGDRSLSVRGPGELVGEIAFLDGGPRSAALVARGETTVRVWSRDALERVFAAEPMVRAVVLESIALSQARSVRQLTETGAAVPAEPVTLDAGRFTDGEAVVLRPDGARVPLTPTEARLLSYLVARPGRTLTHAALLADVWGYSKKVHSRTVYATVHRLRSKVEADPASPRHIVAVPGGYRFQP